MVGGKTLANSEMNTLVVPASRLRWRAPELSLVLSERAAALAASRHDESERLRAEALVAFALTQLGRHTAAAERASAALRVAEAGREPEHAWLFRIELAKCAHAAQLPLAAFGLLTPVLSAPNLPEHIRATALLTLSNCLAPLGRDDSLAEAPAEAERLYLAAQDIEVETTTILRAEARASLAYQRRLWGDIDSAIDAATKGLRILDELTEPNPESGQVTGWLVWELVAALLKANRQDEALVAARSVLDKPVRAAAVEPIGRIKLAVATKIWVAERDAARSRSALWEVADAAERYQRDDLLAQAMLALAHAHELSGAQTEAISCLRNAHSAERRLARSRYAIRVQLAEEFSLYRRQNSIFEQLPQLIRPGSSNRRSTRSVAGDAMHGLLGRTEFLQQLDTMIQSGIQSGKPNVTLSLVLLEVDFFQSNGTTINMGDNELSSALAARIRAVAPRQAAIGKIDYSTFAVSLPNIAADQANRWADELRTEVTQGFGIAVRFHAAIYRQGDRAETLLEAAISSLTGARKIGTTQISSSEAENTETKSIERPARHRSGAIPRWRDIGEYGVGELGTGLDTASAASELSVSPALAQAADRWHLGDQRVCSDQIVAANSLDTTISVPVASAKHPDPAPGARARHRAEQDAKTAPKNSRPKDQVPDKPAPTKRMHTDIWSEYQEAFNALGALSSRQPSNGEQVIGKHGSKRDQVGLELVHPQPQTKPKSSAVKPSSQGQRSHSELGDLLAEAMVAYESGVAMESKQHSWAQPTNGVSHSNGLSYSNGSSNAAPHRRRRHAAPEPDFDHAEFSARVNPENSWSSWNK